MTYKLIILSFISRFEVGFFQMKMKLLALVIFSMISGSFACVNNCKDKALAIEVMSVNFLPNKEELRYLCPKVMTFLECRREFLECPGKSLEELATSSDPDYANEAKAFLAGIGLVRELCDEDSSTHKDYIASQSCYKEFVTETDARGCREDIIQPVEDFIGQIYADKDENDISQEIFNEIECLKNIYELVCIYDRLGEKCGSDAQRTASSAMGRFKGLLGGRSCTKVENLADLTSRFLNFLDLDDQKKTSARQIFDLLKRRR